MTHTHTHTVPHTISTGVFIYQSGALHERGRGRSTCGVLNPLKSVEQTARQYFSHIAHIDAPQTHLQSQSCAAVTFIRQSSVNMPPSNKCGGHMWRRNKVQQCGTCTCNQTGGGQKSSGLRKSVWQSGTGLKSVFFNHYAVSHCCTVRSFKGCG